MSIWLIKKYSEFNAQRWSKLLYLSVFILWLIYLFLSFTTPVAKNNNFHLSQLGLNLIRLSIALPYLIIWGAAVYSYIKLQTYSKSIAGSKEAHGFFYLSIGLLALLSSLIISTLVSAVNSRLRLSSELHRPLTIITNYAFIFPYLFAFWAFWKGSSNLSARIKKASTPLRSLAYAVGLTVFMYIWLDLIFTNASRAVSKSPDTLASYYLKDSLIVLTIVLPSFITWVLGLWAVVNLKNYSQKVKGHIYRSSAGALVRGIWAVIIGSILLQGLLSLGTPRLIDLGLGKILLLIYVFVFLQGFGYLYIALGAKRLTRIETI